MLAEAQKERLRKKEEAERERKRKRKLRDTIKEKHRVQIARAETSKTIQHVVPGSAMVSYGAGALIQHVLPGSNSCRIGVSNLPLDATREEVEGLFTQQGIAAGTFHVLGLAKSPDRHLEADVVIDKERGEKIAVGPEGIEFRDEVLGIPGATLTHVAFTYISRTLDLAFIRVLLGTNKKAVGAPKVRAETLAAGEKLPLWSASFASPAGETFIFSLSTRMRVHARAARDCA
ncbi:hypothetical protein C8F04DRAFT_1389953 [Mycena alexandri]|uniref:Uncharacterized protein n=1 Tax=Mycena alexandri TaxID=1745969 RepID=A0AAD6TBV1_9AGAR|nr:hypothetical protein C8F04DRAFT_1389953 [Mycena alexandri]